MVAGAAKPEVAVGLATPSEVERTSGWATDRSHMAFAGAFATCLVGVAHNCSLGLGVDRPLS